MDLAGRTAVVTGGGNGIGRALVRRFAREGARVVAADLDADAAIGVAREVAAAGGEALGVPCDVADADQVDGLVDLAEERFGPVGVFCANAGVAVGTDEQTPDDDWALAWAVNARAHVLAARRLVPGWLERGEGYFLSTASAAGLLTQIGSAPYAVTKHAAVAFAEWLAVTYGDRGVRVSCLCPMGVDTALLAAGEAEGMGGSASAAVRAAGAVLTPDEVADVVVEAMAQERFLVLPHPEVAEFWRRKTADTDRWIGGMQRLRRRVEGT
jgi:NAD(P)-dependent dehydrogenase (short-subunit alcohol dehydrogenase family)